MISLRPHQVSELEVLTGGQSPFDDFGPASGRTAPAACLLEDDGALTVLTEAG